MKTHLRIHPGSNKCRKKKIKLVIGQYLLEFMIANLFYLARGDNYSSVQNNQINLKCNKLYSHKIQLEEPAY